MIISAYCNYLFDTYKNSDELSAYEKRIFTLESAQEEAVANFVATKLFGGIKTEEGYNSLMELRNENKGIIQTFIDFVKHLKNKIFGDKRTKTLEEDLYYIEHRLQQVLLSKEKATTEAVAEKHYVGNTHSGEDLKDTPDYLKPDTEREWHAFSREFANKTNDLKSGEKRSIIITTKDNVYLVFADGYMSGIINQKYNIDNYAERYQKLNDYRKEFRNDVRSFRQGDFETNNGSSRNISSEGRRRTRNVGVVKNDNRNGRTTDNREGFADFSEEQHTGIVFDGENTYNNYYDENGNFVSEPYSTDEAGSVESAFSNAEIDTDSNKNYIPADKFGQAIIDFTEGKITKEEFYETAAKIDESRAKYLNTKYKNKYRTERKGFKPYRGSIADLKRIGKKLKQSVGSNYDNELLTNELGALMSMAERTNVDFETLSRASRHLAENIVENKKPILSEESREILGVIKNLPFSLNEGQIAEIENLYGSVGKFKKEFRGSISIVDDAPTLDSVWGELSSAYPWEFENDVSDAQMPIELIEKVQNLQNTFEEFEDDSDAVIRVYNDIITEVFHSRRAAYEDDRKTLGARTLAQTREEYKIQREAADKGKARKRLTLKILQI